MKLGALCSAMATLAKQAGPASAILVVALASRPKEEASDDVLDRGAYYWGHKTFWTRPGFPFSWHVKNNLSRTRLNKSEDLLQQLMES